MSDLKVFDTTVPGVLESLRKGEWLVPKFQREFVWSTDQVSALVQSILDARPIGMVTLWEQEDEQLLEIERLSIPDQDPIIKRSMPIFYGTNSVPSKRFALLDGRQRCTAIAMAFGGFRASHGLYRYSGRYYLDVKQLDPRKRVKYVREPEVRRERLDSDASCFSKGLFPLASNQPDEALLGQWMRYLQALQKAENYPNGELPQPGELEKRNQILQDAFEGIVKTKLAVYVVPGKYSLSDICDIFETLNTTGTQVSTVDLIHSWLYAETNSNPPAFLLREWLNDLGQRDGAIGWSSSEDRPELIAQIVTACYVALVQKFPPRKVGSAKKQEAITSIKSSDLLATPTEHWLHMRDEEERLATVVGEAQKVVASGYFPWWSCPYPASLGIYVALRWHWSFDSPGAHPWGIEELNAVFRAFFWRNALSRRYDQGFLTQIGTDISHLKSILLTRQNVLSSAEWASRADQGLRLIFEYPAPTRDELIDWLTNGNQGGALQKALCLPMLAGARRDLVNANISLAYPSTNPVELHHIYPKAWCTNNQYGESVDFLDPERAGRNYIESIANLMPLSRISNNAWRQNNPSQFIRDSKLSYNPIENNLKPLFIDAEGFESLCGGKIKTFWDHRAELIADTLLKFTAVSL
jgi:Protein of unknown function DUF262